MEPEFTTFREQKRRSAASSTAMSEFDPKSMKTPGENYYETLGERHIKFSDKDSSSKRRQTATYMNLPDLVTTKRRSDEHRRNDDEEVEEGEDDSDPTYENLATGVGVRAADEDVESVTYMNVSKKGRSKGMARTTRDDDGALSPTATYDVPRNSRPIYDSPRRTKVVGHERGTPSPGEYTTDTQSFSS